MRSKHELFFTNRNLIVESIPQEAIMDCSHAGSCDKKVEFWVNKLDFAAPRKEMYRYLKSTGAWDKKELSDYNTNLERLFWLICGNLREQTRANEDLYFYLGE